MKSFFRIFLLSFLSLYTITALSQVKSEISVEKQDFCESSIVEFKNLSSTGTDILYQWNFGKEGAIPAPISSNEAQQIFYTTPGQYTISLITYSKTTPENADTALLTITIHKAPTAYFITDKKYCAPATYSFTDSSDATDGSIIEQLWVIEGNSYSGNNVQIFFPNSGNITVNYSITDEFGCASMFEKDISVPASPLAQFDYSIINGCTLPIDVTFVNKSSSEFPTTASWYIDNVKFSDKSSPLYTFNEYGTYSVKLEITGNESLCTDETTKTVTLTKAQTNIQATTNTQTKITPETTIGRGIYNFSYSTNLTGGFLWYVNNETSIETEFSEVFCNDGLQEIKLLTGIGSDCPDTSVFNFTIDKNLNNDFNIYLDNTLQDKTKAICNSTLELSNPYSATATQWITNDQTLTGNVTNTLFCNQGTYAVTLISEYGTQCVDTIKKIISIKDCRLYDIDIESKNTIVKPNDTICSGKTSFSNKNNQYPVTWQYLALSSNSPNAEFSICNSGINTIYLLTQYSNDCIDTFAVNVFVNQCERDSFNIISERKATILNKEFNKVCQGKFMATVSDSSKFISWILQTPKEKRIVKEKDFQFLLESGTNKLGLISELNNGCTDTLYKTLEVDKIKADFDLEATYGCPYPIGVQATNKSQQAVKYEWLKQKDSTLTFLTSTTNLTTTLNGVYKKEHDYFRTAHSLNIPILLVAHSEDGCTDTARKPLIKPLPLAKIEALPKSGCKPLTVDFSSISRITAAENPIVEYQWIFGDGTTATFNKTVIDEETEIFTQCILEHDSLNQNIKDSFELAITKCSNQIITANCEENAPYELKISDCKCVKDYLSCTQSKIYEIIETTNKSYVAEECMLKAARHSGKAISHIYTQTGEYTAKLIVKDKLGCYDTTKVLIEVGDKISADISLETEPAILRQGDSIYLKIETDFENVIDRWDIIDPTGYFNKSCNTSNPFILELSGYFSGYPFAELQATYNGCVTIFPNIFKDSLIISESIFDTVPNVDIDTIPRRFFVVETTPCEYEKVTIKYKSSSSQTAWGIDMGDNTVYENSLLVNHRYKSPGKYTISLIPDLSKPNQKEVYIDSFHVRVPVHAEISLINSDSVVCSYDSLLVSSKNSKDYVENYFEPFLWYVDGIPVKRTWKDNATLSGFDETGKHTIMLLAFDDNYCTDTAIVEIRSTKPTPVIAFDKTHLCAIDDTLSLSIEPFDKSIALWKWNVGNEMNPLLEDEYTDFISDQNFEVPFSEYNQKMHYIRLVAQDSIGCRDTVSKSIWQYAPQASFYMTNLKLCAGETAGFFDLSTSNDHYTWVFSNGDTLSDIENPSITHDIPGDFWVKQYATKMGNCIDSTQLVYSVEAVDAHFTASKYVICSGNSIDFAMDTVISPVTVFWDFSDNLPLNTYATSPITTQHSFNKGGNQTISLTVESSHGCTAQYDTSIYVISAQPTISDSTICAGDKVIFTNQNTQNATYVVDFGNGKDTTLTNFTSLKSTYLNRGVYTYSISAQTAACSDTYTGKIYVEEVDARFTVSDSIVCNYYLKGQAQKNLVSFKHTNIPDPIVSGSWKFHETALPSNYMSATALWRYTIPGTMIANLQVTTAHGCTDSFSDTIIVNGTLGNFSPSQSEICIGDEVLFTPSNLVNVDSLVWIFDDGFASNEMNPWHQYNGKGTVEPILKLFDSTGCQNIIGPKPITVYEVIAGFSVDNTLLCEYDTLQIAEFSSGATKWNWDFGNGDTRSQRLPKDYAYSKAGIYTVSLIASNHIACADTATVSVEVFPVPRPEFTMSKPFLCAPADTLQLDYLPKDTSIVTFIWSLGNNNTLRTDGSTRYFFDPATQNDSSIVEPYSYSKDTSLLIKLNATDFRGCKFTVSKSIDVFGPKVAYTIPDPLGCAGEPMRIINNSFSVDSISWDLGNGNVVSSLSDFDAFYEKRGDYKITVVGFKNLRCKDTVSKTINIQEIDAHFNISSHYICDNDSVLFRHSYIPDPVSGTWKFGNGSTEPYIIKADSIQKYIYTTGGEYTASLSVSTSNGCKDSFDTLITVNQALPIISDDKICVTDTVLFYNTTHLAQTYYWYFGKADTIAVSTNDVLEIAYPQRGNYEVSLIAFHPLCSDTLVLKNRINVQEVQAAFTTNVPVICDNGTILTNHTYHPDSVAGTWNWGDNASTAYASMADSTQNHIYTKGGKYTISLSVETSNGCSDTASVQIAVNQAKPVIEDTTLCVNQWISVYNEYSEADSYKWDFGNDTVIERSTNDTFNIMFPNRGTYTVKLIAVNSYCNDTIELKNKILVEEVDAAFTVSDSVVCNFYPDSAAQKNAITALHQSYPDAIVAGAWYVNNNLVSSYTSPDDAEFKHLLTQLGNNTIKLDVQTANGCAATSEKNILVNGSLGAFTVSQTDICKGEQIQLTVKDTVQVHSVEWHYGNGKISNEFSHTISYDQIGTMPIKLILFDKTGCVNQLAEQEIYIHEVVANFAIADTNLCIGESLLLTDASEQTTKWNWNFGDGSSATEQNPIDKSFTTAGKYKITLFANDNSNCADTMIQNVVVYPHPELLLRAKQLICLDSAAVVTAYYDHKNSIIWYKNNEVFTANTHTITDFEIADSNTYKVTITDSLSCSSTDSIEVKTRKYPAWKQNLSDTSVVIGEFVELKISTDFPLQYKWTPETNIVETENGSIRVRVLGNEVYTVVASDSCHSTEFHFDVRMYSTDSIPCNADLPTAFSPNSDGTNDMLYIRGWGMEQLEFLRIFNRFGQEVFFSDDLAKGWDGSYRDKQQGIETFSYHFKLTTYCGETIEKKGYFDLMR